MQNFMPRSRVWIFRNECTRSTPLDPKLLFGSVVFGCIWDRSVALRYSVENGTNCCNKCKSSSHKVALEFFCNKSPYPLHILGHFIVFGCTWDHFVTAWISVQKWVEVVQLIQKFVPRTCVWFFATNPPDPPYWTLNSCFGVFHSVWVHLG